MKEETKANKRQCPVRCHLQEKPQAQTISCTFRAPDFVDFHS